MKTLQTFSALVLTLFIIIHCDAQRTWGHIDSVKMIPSYPSMNDTLYVIFYNSFPSSGISSKQRFYEENLPYINNTSKYCIGNLAFHCYDNDTIKIHPLLPGSYFFHYKIERAYYISGCDPYIPADSVDFLINVNYPAAVNKIYGSKSLFNLKNDPNFNKLFLYLNQNLRNYTVIIQNILGKETYRSRLYELINEISIDWEDGIYLVTVFNKEIMQTQKVIIKNNH